MKVWWASAVLMVAASPSAAAISMFFGGTAKETLATLASMCMANNAIISEQDDYHLSCEREVSGMRGALAQLLMGNRYSTTPVVHVRFQVFKAISGTGIQATQWAETQMAFGQIRRIQMDSGKAADDLVASLKSVGGSMTTVFPKTEPKSGEDTPICDLQPSLSMCSKN